MAEAIVVGGFTLGAVFITLGWQFLLERQRRTSTRNGMLKAILVELRHNASVCLDRQILPDNTPIARLTTDSWSACRFDLAQFLPDDVYETLVFTYEDEIPRLQLIFDNPDPASSMVLATIFCKELKEAMQKLLALPEASSFRDRFNIRLYEETIVDEDFVDDGTGVKLTRTVGPGSSTHWSIDES